MNPTEEDIKEIAEILACGELCFFHKPSGSIEHHPDPNDLPDPEFWQETINKIEADISNYKRFEKMNSRQSFQVMEYFANSLTDINFRTSLLDLLAEPKPFGKFRRVIDNSDYRQDWFDFKNQAHIDWVREQINSE